MCLNCAFSQKGEMRTKYKKKIKKTDMVREAYVLKIIKLDICMEHLEKKTNLYLF